MKKLSLLLALAVLPLGVQAQNALAPGSALDTPVIVPERGGGISITQSASLNIEGGGVACASNTPPNYTTENQYLRVFKLSDFAEVTGDFNVTSVDVGVGNIELVDVSTVETTVNLYTMEGGVNYASTFERSTLTNIGTASFTLSSSDQPDVYSVDIASTEALSPTDTLVVEWSVPDGTLFGFDVRYGQNDDGQTGATYIATTISCGPLPPTDVAQLGDFSDLHWVLVVNGAMASANEGDAATRHISLGASAPNPFASSSTITFDVEQPSDVRLAVYDVLGREVAVLVDGAVAAGSHTATFDARSLPAGAYIYRLEANGAVLSQMATVVR